MAIATTAGMVTNLSPIPDPTQTLYTKMVLEVAKEQLLLRPYMKGHTLNKNQGQVQMWRKLDRLAFQIAQLTEGAPPTEISKTRSDFKIQLAQYGAFLKESDFLWDTQLEDHEMIDLDLIGTNAAESLERLAVVGLGTGITNAYFLGNATSKVTIGSDDIANTANNKTWYTVVRDLANNLAPRFTNLAPPNQNVSTSGLMPAYLAYITEDMFADLRQDTDFQLISAYPNPAIAMPGELGYHKAGIRFFVASRNMAYFEAGAGAAGTTVAQNNGVNFDVHHAFVFGRDAYHGLSLNPQSLQVIVHRAGSGGGPSDPLNQINTVGWKFADGRGLLYGERAANVMGAVTL